jgi:hypothetical protein
LEVGNEEAAREIISAGNNAANKGAAFPVHGTVDKAQTQVCQVFIASGSPRVPDHLVSHRLPPLGCRPENPCADRSIAGPFPQHRKDL